MTLKNTSRGLAFGLCLSITAMGWAQDEDLDLDALFGPAAADQTADDDTTQAPTTTPVEPAIITLPERPPPKEVLGNGRRVIEEIVVTAQKREEGLREVPISLSVFDADFMLDNAITDFRDLSQFVPNARIDTNGTLPQLSIRGFNAHPLNRAFEQAISLVTDGVTYGSSPFFQTPLYDIQRVEVLRGPQGTLFGKNSTAGAFNIVTRAADDDSFTGHIGLQAGELGRQRLEFGLGDAIRPGLHWRLAGLYEQRDGLTANTSHPAIPGALPRGNARERRALRLKLGGADLWGMAWQLSAETVAVDLDGFGAELKIVPDTTQDLYRAFDADFDAIPNNYIGSVDAPEFTRIRGEIFSLKLTRPLAGWDTTLVLGHADLRYENLADVDFSPAPALALFQSDSHPQTTVELRTSALDLPGFGRLLGRDDDGLDLTVGVFWQRRGFRDAEGGLRIDPLAAGLLLAADSAPIALPAPPPGSIPPNNEADDEVGIIFYDQRNRSLAGFGQMDWRFWPDWTLQLGLRWSDERKRANWNTVTNVQGAGLFAFAALGREPYTARRQRREIDLSPKALLKYDISPDANIYLGWVRAFRAGGFNQIASTGDPDGLEYGQERVRSWELGSKLNLLGGAARLNLGLFWMNLEDFQVLTQDPSDVGFVVLNAGEARARGLEADGLWLINDWLSLQGSLGFNDNEFLDFPFGTCANDRIDTDEDGDERCDISGEPLDFASKVTATLNPRIEMPWRRWQLRAGLVAAYQSGYFADNAVRDPRVYQKGVTRWNASIGIGPGDGRWALRLVGENLTDEAVAVYQSDVPLATGTFYQTLDPGRLLFSEFTWRF